ncbi:MAG: hypothetical protein GY773_31585, partial [Actinomycetia bacterium]|nr:hypothetical protein [Actinomycetes bacterium]
MATTIQIVVAGALLLAWIWALGRPLAGSIVSSDYRQLDNGQAESATNESADRASHGIGDSTVVATFIEWARRPAAAWRRQLMLATMFASFASFLLAIALRGSFVLLFALMMTILFVHIFVAAYIGGRMLSVERAIFVQAAKKKVQRSGGISIRAERAGAQTPPSSSADGESDEQSELVRGSGSAAFDVAAELASQLAETPTPSPPPVEEETVDTVVATADENASAEEADTTAEVDA